MKLKEIEIEKTFVLEVKQAELEFIAETLRASGDTSATNLAVFLTNLIKGQ